MEIKDLSYQLSAFCCQFITPGSVGRVGRWGDGEMGRWGDGGDFY
ncbi:hypothetical protein [Moorena sp. SIO3H5]|nr:hypothetical protein [Moorena sp. SIO3H5]